MIGNWQRTLANYWTNTQQDTEATLQFLKGDFRCSGLSFDDNFKEYFLRETNDRVAQAYERCLRNAKFEEQFIAVRARNHESADQKTNTDASGGTASNVSNNCHQTVTDPITSTINQEVNVVTNWPHTLPSSTPFYGELRNDTFQPFTSFLDNTIDPNNATESVAAMIEKESILIYPINESQAAISSGIDRNENRIAIGIEISSERTTMGNQGPNTSIRPTTDMIIPTVVPPVNGVDQGSDVNEHQSMPNTTAFHELSVIQIPNDETIQRFASIVSKNIGENNVRASLGATLGNESMSAKFDEPQATLMNGNGISEDDMRNGIAVNGISKGVMTNVQTDPAISEYDEIIVTNVSELETIHADRPNNLPVVDLINRNVEVSPKNVSNQREINQVTMNKRRKRKIDTEVSSWNGNSKKKRKIEQLSESTLIYVASMGETKSSKQSKKVQRNETKPVGVQPNGSTSNGKSKTKCEFCNYVAYPSHLIIHRRMHTGEKPFECKICAKRFTRTYVLKTHMRTHANQFPFHCSICRQGFAVKWGKDTHEKNCDQRRFECYLCKYATLHKGHLVRHLHIHTGELPFKCKICAKGFAQKGVHTRHMRTHANQFPFHCSICRQGFAVKWAKEAHEKNCNQRRFECYLCKYATLRKTHLVYHMRLHTGDKPFRCSHCSKRFVTKSQLKRHQKRHQNKTK